MKDTTRLLEMADYFDGLPSAHDVHAGDAAVDMSAWRCSIRSKRGCGTVGCIAGHTVMRYDGRTPSGLSWAARAADLLGLCDAKDYTVGGPYGRIFEGDPVRYRRVTVAGALFHPPSEVGDVTHIHGSPCSTVMRAVAEDADTITADEVGELWRRVTAG